MKKTGKINSEEKVTDIKGTIVGFVAPDPKEKTQEQEIQDFELKKQSERELARLSEEEQKKKRKEYAKEEERLEKVKAELLQSIKVRIPAIEKKFKIELTNNKKVKVVEKQNVKGRVQSKHIEQQQEKQNEDEKERE